MSCPSDEVLSVEEAEVWTWVICRSFFCSFVGIQSTEPVLQEAENKC